MSLHDEMLLDRDEVILGDFPVTVINLTARQTCKGFFQGNDVAADSKTGLKNVIKSTLWVPVEVNYYAQEQKVLIVMPDAKREEFTVTACGARQGAFRKVELEQVSVTRMRQGVGM